MGKDISVESLSAEKGGAKSERRGGRGERRCWLTKVEGHILGSSGRDAGNVFGEVLRLPLPALGELVDLLGLHITISKQHAWREYVRACVRACVRVGRECRR